MENQNKPYTVSYIPDPLCWTEVPEDMKIFINQRDRWARGNLETLVTHRDMFFNPRFGRLGMLSYPYWLFYEWLTPLLEFFGFISVVIFYMLGILNWKFFLVLTAMVYTFAVMFSVFALLMDVFSYNQYKSTKDILVLVGCAFLEPFIFHPIVVWSAVRGNYKKLIKANAGWGEQVRKGFVTSQT